LDSRQPLTKIGKKVGLKKDVVSYRIKRLQDLGIIKNFYTVIDAYKLGYNVFRFYLDFQYVTSEIKNEIIEHFVDYRNTWVVYSIREKYDLGLVLWVKNIQEFHNFWDDTLDKYGDYFAKKIFSIYIQAFSYRPSYLLLDKYKKSDRSDYEIVGMGKKVDIDALDYKLLNKLAVNARASLIDLSEKLSCSPQSVNYRIKNLIKSKLIQAFRTAIDISKFGLHQYKIDIYLREHKQRKNIINYVKYNPNLMFISTSAGFSDLELEFHLENADKVNHVMEEISRKFPGAIRNYDYISADKFYKVRLMPEI
jgi:DNA-binding Lrp family transcriptional regulator